MTVAGNVPNRRRVSTVVLAMSPFVILGTSLALLVLWVVGLWLCVKFAGLDDA